MFNGFNGRDLWLFLPEMALACGVVALFVTDLFLCKHKKKRQILLVVAVAILGACAWLLALTHTPEAAQTIFSQQLAIDRWGQFFKWLFVVIALFAVITAVLSQEVPSASMGEYLALLLAITLGMSVMASASDMLTLYLGVELVSIVSYALAGYRLHDRRSSEAALKYVVYGGAASGMMLFGISLYYGLLGTTALTPINAALQAATGAAFGLGAGAGAAALPLALTLAFIFAGIAFKLALVPFHMWAPDVYEGAPTPLSGFLSVGPKAAAFALLARLLYNLFVPLSAAAPTAEGSAAFALADQAAELGSFPVAVLLGVIAAVTMTLGNLAALAQRNVKRLLAYSSIAHAGYILMGFAVLSAGAMHAVVLYLAIYFLMNLGAFTVVQAVRDRTGGETIEDFRGLGARAPWLAICMVVFLFSLTGVPPTAGFVAKFYLFAAVLMQSNPWYAVLAIVAALNSVVSLYYYLRIARAMFLSEPVATAAAPLRPGLGYSAVTTALAVPTVVLCFAFSPLSQAVRASLALYRPPEVARTAVGQTPAQPVPSAAVSAELLPLQPR